MSKQNKYDESPFFESYSQMPRSVEGLRAAGEWEEFRGMLPNMAGRRVLDLGCGYGWHCRYAREQGAKSVLGIDLSEKMLLRAAEMTSDEGIEYRRMPIEDISFDNSEFDVVISSLALHYVNDFDQLCHKIYHALSPGGSFVFSVEHPIFTALPGQDWHYGPDGEKLHWPLDRYHDEGVRHTRFLGHDVTKVHRTVSSYLNALIGAGFRVAGLSELKPTADMLEKHPEWQTETRRPMFLLISALRE
ncbi:class I SAM-dependent methyltransferase [Paenibacillus soyae]|uniref:Class I SAM-dependent methyltransferase n=1 Tax=Paenibacillus soyae TaxID=2969249 RepID=A0A9X2MP66_9BACL|nr:class I SAM-dependent methyltransferase [Paenibacillus soyae]MCR2803669.1 class I SAM-dependent methyltransferase [Paenibacillus soyae]